MSSSDLFSASTARNRATSPPAIIATAPISTHGCHRTFCDRRVARPRPAPVPVPAPVPLPDGAGCHPRRL